MLQLIRKIKIAYMKSLPITNRHFKFTIAKYESWLKAIGYSESQVYGGPSLIRGYLFYLEQNGVQHIRQSNRLLIDEFVNEMRNRTNVRTGELLTMTHVNSYITELKRFGKFLWESNGVDIKIDHLKQIKVERKIKDVLTVDEVKELYNQTNETAIGFRDRAMLALYYGCGLRRSEAINLNLEDVLVSKRLLLIRKAKNGQQRFVPINLKSMEHIQKYIEDGRCQFVKKHTGNALLINERGNRCEGQSLNLRLKGLQNRSELKSLRAKKIGLHSLRHSIATHLMMNGMEFDRISQFLGHTSIESTQIYTHLANELNNGKL